MKKHPLDLKRLRQVPTQFSWVDHRLVRSRLLSATSPTGWALYLFLIVVGDEQGLSYYSSRSICEHLGIDSLPLSQARRELLDRDLIAWEAPLYQVLDLRHLNARPSAPSAAVSPLQPASAGSTSMSAATPRPQTTAPAISTEAGHAQSLRLAHALEQIVKGGAQ
jgi:hypothetical protein